MLFFIFFLLEGLKQKTLARNALIVTTLFSLAGIVLTPKYPVIKLLLSLGFLVGLWLLYAMEQANKTGSSGLPGLQSRPVQSLIVQSRMVKSISKEFYVLLICVVSFLVFLGSSYSNARQLGRYLTWGYNNEMSEIADRFKDKEAVWINVDSSISRFVLHK